MAYTRTLALDKAKTATLVKFITLVGIATIVPLFHQQWLTGPLVNAVFFIGVIMLGTQNTILLALLPSTIALSVGLLPAVLAPMIPFIIISNTLMILVFAGLKEKNYWLGVGVASLLKFLFLLSTSSVVVNLLLKKQIAATVSAMMSWPQLITALLGGLIAYIILRAFKKI